MHNGTTSFARVSKNSTGGLFRPFPNRAKLHALPPPRTISCALAVLNVTHITLCTVVLYIRWRNCEPLKCAGRPLYPFIQHPLYITSLPQTIGMVSIYSVFYNHCTPFSQPQKTYCSAIEHTESWSLRLNPHLLQTLSHHTKGTEQSKSRNRSYSTTLLVHVCGITSKYRLLQ